VTVSSPTIFYSLALANPVVFSVGIAGVIRARLRKMAYASSIEDAFAVPRLGCLDLSEGFTWNEVLTRLKSSKQKLNCWEIQQQTLKGNATSFDVIIQQVLDTVKSFR